MKKVFLKIFTFISLMCLLGSALRFFGSDVKAYATDGILDKEYLVVFVKFSDSQDFDEEFLQRIKRTYSSSPQSVAEYFKTLSNEKFGINFNFLESVICLNEKKSSFEPKYYYSTAKKEYVVKNEDGYDNRYFYDGEECEPQKTGAKRHIDRLLVEQSLLRKIVSAVKNIDDELNLDSDGDGVIDGINVIFQIDDEDFLNLSWDDIFWAHRSNVLTYDKTDFETEYYIPDDVTLNAVDFLPKYINSAVAKNYAVFSSSALQKRSNVLVDDDGKKIYSPTTICHELLHDLGLSDYYSYDDSDEVDWVGELDIMGEQGILPQSPLAYNLLKLGWIDDGEVCPIETSGSYTLFPTTFKNGVKAYKLVLNDYNVTGEYFMIEVRDNGGNFIDGGLSDSGLIIYRVNEKNGYIGFDGETAQNNYGNMYGSPEVYVYRAGNGIMSDGKAEYSYAIFNGEKINAYHYDLKAYYDNSTIGVSEKSVTSPQKDTETDMLLTPILYSNGENSGIKLSNIAKNPDGSVSFKIEFDDEDFASDIQTEVLKYYDGKRDILKWTSGLRGGNVEIYAYPAEGLVKYKNEDYLLKKKVTLDDLRSKKLYGNDLSYFDTTPASYSFAFIPTFKEPTALFLAYENGDEKTVVFVGVLNPRAPTFKEYLFGTTKWLVMIIIIGVIALLLIVGVIVYFAVKELKPKKVNDIEEDVDLSSEYGENYWVVNEAGDLEEVADLKDDAEDD